jgi:hypothetical protein
MKMVVVTEKGQIQGFAHGSKADHTVLHTTKKAHAGLRLLPGQEMHEVDVPDELATVQDGQEIYRRLSQLLKR